MSSLVDATTTFVPGDLVRQRYVAHGPRKLVIATTPNPDVVVVLCPVRGVHKVLAWGHELIGAATPESREEANNLSVVAEVNELLGQLASA